jgi:hypothetical protein
VSADRAGLSAPQEPSKEPISLPQGNFSISVNNSLLIAITRLVKQQSNLSVKNLQGVIVKGLVFFSVISAMRRTRLNVTMDAREG